MRVSHIMIIMKRTPIVFRGIDQFFGRNFFAAIHISEETISGIVFSRVSDRVELKEHARYFLPVDIMSDPLHVNESMVVGALKTMKKKIGVKTVAMIVPSPHFMTGEHLEAREQMSLLYRRLAASAGLSVRSLVYEDTALLKTLSPGDRNNPTILVRVNPFSSSIYIVEKGKVIKETKSYFSGTGLTNLLHEKCGVGRDEAHRVKCEEGLRTLGTNRTRDILLEAAMVLKDDIEQSFISWHQSKSRTNIPGPSIKKIILLGSESYLYGLADYLSSALKIEVEHLDVWKNVLDVEASLPTLNKRDSLDYGEVIGGALYEFIK